MELRAQIRNAFPLEPLPRFKLSDALVMDAYGDQTVRFEENWRDWTEIEDWQIEKSDCTFAHLAPQDSNYYLGRYMIWILDDIEGVFQRSPRRVAVPECAWFLLCYLERLHKKDFKNSGLTDEQIEVVKTFLKVLAEDPEYGSDLKFLKLN